ncbi:hypothetical protein KT99_18135 [Shewanella benthica KT99]|uniref:Uncharacterized protein n=1 Tax=Shewanella benthica KT99 TaxID=314608 RepID=A9EL53_9GAMM|nr:hypothetical protein KT99_18135 [Shewanella benthica KT99]
MWVDYDFLFYAIEDDRGFDPEHKVYIMTSYPWCTDEKHLHRKKEMRWDTRVLG